MSANSKVPLQAFPTESSGSESLRPDTSEKCASLKVGFQMPSTVIRKRLDVFEMALGISCNFLEQL